MNIQLDPEELRRLGKETLEKQELKTKQEIAEKISILEKQITDLVDSNTLVDFVKRYPRCQHYTLIRLKKDDVFSLFSFFCCCNCDTTPYETNVYVLKEAVRQMNEVNRKPYGMTMTVTQWGDDLPFMFHVNVDWSETPVVFQTR